MVIQTEYVLVGVDSVYNFNSTSLERARAFSAQMAYYGQCNFLLVVTKTLESFAIDQPIEDPDLFNTQAKNIS